MASLSLSADAFAKASAHDKHNISGIVTFLQSKVAAPPDVAVICGSGLANLHEMLVDTLVIPYASIPGFPLSTVEGQVGELVFGTLSGVSVVLMRGRFHFYEGYEPSRVSLPIRVFAALGVRVVVVTNASGGVNPEFNIGDFMVISDHLSFPGLSGVNPLIGENDPRFGPRFPAVTPAYSPVLQELALKTAASLGLSARMRVGTYVGVAGPTYETPHEIGAMRMLGGDAVGMSTVPEIIQCAHVGLSVLGLGLISNRCKAPGDTHVNPSHQEVLDSVSAASDDMKRLIGSTIAGIDVSSFPRTPTYTLFQQFAAAAPAAPATCPATGKSGGKCPFSSGDCAKSSAAGGCPVVTAGIVGALTGTLAAAILFAILKKK